MREKREREKNEGKRGEQRRDVESLCVYVCVYVIRAYVYMGERGGLTVNISLRRSWCCDFYEPALFAREMMLSGYGKGCAVRGFFFWERTHTGIVRYEQLLNRWQWLNSIGSAVLLANARVRGYDLIILFWRRPRGRFSFSMGGRWIYCLYEDHCRNFV